MPVDELEITPVTHPLSAAVRVPGSKSISNRALLLAAMATGDSSIESVLFSDDTEMMIRALRVLGFVVKSNPDSDEIIVEGRAGTIPVSRADLEIGGAGTAMRFLAGLLTLGRGHYRIDGNERMRQRPIAALLEGLRGLGIDARSESGNGCPPVVLELQSPCRGGAVTIDARLSSQFASALLMPAAIWPSGLKLTIMGDTARPFIEMTLRLMDQWGAHAAMDGDVVVVPGGQSYTPGTFTVEPDATSASYFAAAAAVIGGSVELRGLKRDSVQGDTAFIEVLARMGAHVEWIAGGVRITGTGGVHGVDLEMNDTPDVVPTLAAIAPFASSPTRIRKVAFIRHHESDRLAALAMELRRIGAVVTELPDGLEIMPSQTHAAAVETYNDHRIAMAFAIAGLKSPGIRIKDPGCVAKTYPGFFDDLKSLY